MTTSAGTASTDGYRQNRTRVVQDSPAGDFGQTQRHQDPPQPRRVEADGALRRILDGRHRLRLIRRSWNCPRGWTARSAPEPVRRSSRPRIPRCRVRRKHLRRRRLRFPGGSTPPEQRPRDRRQVRRRCCEPARTRSSPGTSAHGRSSSSPPGTRRVRGGEVLSRRADRLCRRSGRSGRSTAPTA